MIREQNLTFIETGLDTLTNRTRVLAALNELGWSIVENHPQEIKAAVPHKWYGFVQQTATVLVTDNALLLNITHQGTFKGRVPFSFGQNERKLTMLIDAIQTL